MTPTSLCNALTPFHSSMNQLSYDHIDVSLVVCMDDLLIFSKDEERHIKYMRTILYLDVSSNKC